MNDAWRAQAIALCAEMRQKIEEVEQLLHSTDRLLCNNPEVSEVRWRNLIIDTYAPFVSVAGSAIHLTQTEWQILSYLAINKNKWCHHSLIAHHVWRDDIDGVGTSITIKTYICHIRKKLQPLAIIESLYGSGYRCFLPEE